MRLLFANYFQLLIIGYRRSSPAIVTHKNDQSIRCGNNVMELLVEDCLVEVLQRLSTHDLLHFCSINRYYYDFFRNILLNLI